ncbi:MAG: hypothetical protein KBS64_02280 [Treponema sp.]|nr:hypothetical protein [Candidatus Treponema equi]
MKFRSLSIALFASLVALCFVSCSSHSEGSSFTTHLDSIDAFISQNSHESALKALKKLENKAYSSYERLGIYKRYILLGEKKAAEKVLVKGLKKLPENLELSAIYVDFLLRNDRLEDAFTASRCLEGSPYSSFYSECVLKKALVSLEEKGEVLDEAFASRKKKSKKQLKASQLLSEKTSREIKEIFCNSKFVPIYTGAFNGSKDNKWIYNAASVLMKNGEYREASQLYPQKITNYKDSLFWGCIFFDAGLYAQSLSALEASDRLASLDGTGDYSVDLYAQILSLRSDGTYVEGNDDESEALRNKLCAIDDGRYVTPLVLMNGAMYSKRNDDKAVEYQRLEKLVDTYPHFIPGISGFGQLAIEQLNAPKEDSLAQQLRVAGLKTLEMEKRDRIPVVNVSDVNMRIDALQSEEKNPQLDVLKDILAAEECKSINKEKSVSDIWNILESSEQDNSYPSEISRYCVASLIERRMPKEAYGLFDGYIKKKYDFDIYENPEEIDLWECEYAAWFACKNGDFQKGGTMYRFIADRYGQRLPSLNSSSGNRSVINSLVNLAVVYASIDHLHESLEMLSLASARTADGREKAEILYRMAEVSWNLGDSRSASRSLKYCLTLDGTHNRARLLQKKIKAAR